MPDNSPFDPFIKKYGICILDGGLATELEYMGYDLNHPLWSAKILMTNPEAIRDVHTSYLRAGSDGIITSSYQISFEGCAKMGISRRKTTELLRKSLDLATEAKSSFIADDIEYNRVMPIVAASIGPYGAYLADGSEYTGKYNISNDKLYEFHTSRWEVLAEGNADIFACETIPSIQEAIVLLKLIEQSNISVYLSFSCKDPHHVNDGTPIKECAAIFASCPQVKAVGINCTAPQHLSSLIRDVKSALPEKEIIVYPNSGETYDGDSKSWKGECSPESFSQMAHHWLVSGARVIGGCCRTRPAYIQAIRVLLNEGL